MTKQIKRPISMLLAILMIVGMLTVIPITSASAATTVTRYELATVSGSALEANGEYLIVSAGAAGDAEVMYNNNGSLSETGIEVHAADGSISTVAYIDAADVNTGWVFTGVAATAIESGKAGATLTNGGNYLDLYQSQTDTGNGRTLRLLDAARDTYYWSLTDSGAGQMCYRNSSGTKAGYILYYNNSFVARSGHSETGYNKVYVYKKVTKEVPDSYTVTTNPGTHGSITADATVFEGSDLTFTVTPYSGYEIDTVTAYDTADTSTTYAVSGSGGSYTVYNVTGNITIAATFKKSTVVFDRYKKTTTLSANTEYMLVSADGYAIKKDASGNTVSAQQVTIHNSDYVDNSDSSLIWTTGSLSNSRTSFSNSGNYLYINNSTLSTGTSTNANWSRSSSGGLIRYAVSGSNRYPYHNSGNSFTVTNNSTAPSSGGISLYAKVTSYDITTNVGEGGTVDAPTKAYAGYGYTFTVTPETGYVINSVTVNNAAVTPDSDGVCTVSTVNGAQSISVTFKRVYTITWNDENGNLIDTTTVDAGAVPTHADPTKAADEDYTYTFTGWDPAPVEAVEDATYTAQFTPVAKYEAGYFIVGTMTNWEFSTAYPLDLNEGAEGVEYKYSGFAFDANDQFKVVYAAPGGTRTWFPDPGENYTVNTAGKYDVYFRPNKDGGDGWHYNVIYVTPTVYTITWNDDEGNLIDTTKVAYGQTPTHADPTKAATAEYTYTFAGWTPTVVAVTGNATYQATFTATKRSYTITWLNDDDSEIDTTTVAYGTVPTHADATKAPTDAVVYTFAGWDTTPVAVTGEATYKATYTESARPYTITFVNYDNEVLQSGDVEYGQLPVYTGDDPVKPEDHDNTYTFAGWDSEVVAVTGEATYKATFTPHEITYWTISDATTDTNGSVTINAEGNEVRDGGEFTFTVAANSGYEVKKVTVNNAEVNPVNGVYTVSNVTEDQEIVATFKTVSYIYLRVDTLDTDSEYLLVETAAEGKGHAVWNNNGTIGAKEVDILTNNLGSYILSAGADIIWTTGATTTSFMNNSHNASTTTPYLRIQSSGGVIFYNEDHAWNYDSSTHKLTYHKSSDDPVLYYKDANTGFIGTGSGNNTVTTANATDAMVMYLYKKVYIGTVTFKDDSGNVLDSAVYVNGTVPTHDAPTKDATAQYTYTFAGWNDGENTYAPGEALPAVDGDVTYTAVFTETINKYTITFVDYDGTELQSSEVEYGETPVFSQDNPTRAENVDYTYTFSGWDKPIASVTGAETYTAVYEPTAKYEKGYYIVGTMTNWEFSTAYPLTLNESAQGVEYKYSGFAFDDNDAFKVIYAEPNLSNPGGTRIWYPAAENKTIATAGNYDIYFRPNGDGGQDWFYNVIYVTPTVYTITWLDDDNTALGDPSSVAYGSKPVYNNGVDPTKESTAQFDYTFAGWDDGNGNIYTSADLPTVTGEATYKATYTAETRSYTITWKLDANTVIDTTTVAYGTVPTHADPTKEGHAFSGWTPEVVAVTGEATYTATFYADEVGAKLAGHTISLGGDIGVNFYMELADSVIADEDAYMHFVIPRVEDPGYTVQDIPVKDIAPVTSGNKKYYIFKCEVAAKEMTSDISAQIISEGKESTTYHYSVQNYAEYLLAHPEVQEYYDAAPLVKAMLNYGTAAQIYFDRNTDNLANSILTSADQTVTIDVTAADLTAADTTGITADSINKPYDGSLTSMPAGVSFTNVTLTMNAETSLSLYFKSTTRNKLTFTCTMNNQEMTVETEHVGATWVARIRGINAKDLGNDFVLSIVADDTDNGTVTYCPMTYCYNVLNRGTGTKNLPAVVKTMYLYWVAADAYFDN